MSDIERRVRRIVADTLQVNDHRMRNSDTLFNDLRADSLNLFELVMALEEEFGANIPEEDAEKIETVQDMIDYIKASQG